MSCLHPTCRYTVNLVPFLWRYTFHSVLFLRFIASTPSLICFKISFPRCSFYEFAAFTLLLPSGVSLASSDRGCKDKFAEKWRGLLPGVWSLSNSLKKGVVTNKAILKESIGAAVRSGRN